MVETKFIVPPRLVMPDTNLKMPVADDPRFRVDDCQLIVPVNPVVSNELHAWVPVTDTTPRPELASNKQSSEAVGTDAPEAPPVVADQFAVVDASQVAVPPTQ